MAELQKIVDQLSKLTVLEASELVKMLEDKWGVLSIPQNNIEEHKNKQNNAQKEKSKFTVVLKSIGEKRISVIKTVKSITGLMLKEAKNLVESIPANIKENVSKEEAEKIKGELLASGAEVDLK